MSQLFELVQLLKCGRAIQELSNLVGMVLTFVCSYSPEFCNFKELCPRNVLNFITHVQCHRYSNILVNDAVIASWAGGGG